MKLGRRVWKGARRAARALAGLGLSLVQDLLRHLGGTIVVRSVQGEGSRFTVTLPVRHPSLDEPVPTHLPDELTAGS